MSDFSRSRLFWSGTKGSNAARVGEKQLQEQLNAKMGRERIMARYQELKERADRSAAGTQAKQSQGSGGRASKTARSPVQPCKVS
jgi:hypothetical protein